MKALTFFAAVFGAWWLVDAIDWPAWVGLLGFIALSISILVGIGALLKRLF